MFAFEKGGGGFPVRRIRRPKCHEQSCQVMIPHSWPWKINCDVPPTTCWQKPSQARSFGAGGGTMSWAARSRRTWWSNGRDPLRGGRDPSHHHSGTRKPEQDDCSAGEETPCCSLTPSSGVCMWWYLLNFQAHCTYCTS